MATAHILPGRPLQRTRETDWSWAMLAAGLASTMLLWVPRPLSAANISAAFFVPFLIFLWPLFARVDRHGAARASRLRLLMAPEIAAAAIILSFAALSILSSPEPARAFRVILPMLFGLGAMLLLPRLPSRSCRRLTTLCLLAGALVVAVALLLAQLPGTRTLSMRDYRLTGFFDNAIQQALSLLLFLPLALALALMTRRWWVRALATLAFAVMALALLLTGGKTALLLAVVATSATAIFYVSRDPRGTRAAMRILLTLGIILLLLPLILFTLERLSPVTFNKIAEVFAGGVGDYATIRSRNLIWDESLRLGFENPLLGVGAGTRVLDVSHSHNVLLDYFRGIGLIGALAMLLLMLVAAWRTARFVLARFGRGLEHRWEDTFVAALYLGGFAYLLGNLLSDSLSPSTSFFFFLTYVTAICSEQDGISQRLRQGAVRVLAPGRPPYSGRLARQPSASPPL